MQGSSLNPIDAFPPFHIVEVEFQHPVFGHQDFHDHSYLGFQILAKVVPVCGQKQGAGQLITDGAGTIADFSGGLIAFPGIFSFLKLKAEVLVKVSIFNRDRHLSCGGWNAFQVYIFSIPPFVSSDQIPLQHQRRDGRIDEDVEETQEHRYTPKPKMREPDKAQYPDRPGSALEF